MSYSWSPPSVVEVPEAMANYKIVEKVAMDSRYWITDVDEGDPDPELGGWFGVVDEQEGGVVAYAGTLALAQKIRSALVGP